jgi:hypothetical protein
LEKKMMRALMVAAVAGSLVSTTAMAQKVAAPKAAAKTQVVAAKPHLVAAVPHRGRNPDFVRRVQRLNGMIVGTSDWQPYHGRQTDDVSTYVFDAIQDDPGAVPGTQPLTNRYLLEFTTGLFDYTSSFDAHDMQGILPAGRGHGAKMLDTLFYENAPLGTPLYVSFFTSESAPSTPTAPDPSWGVFDGIQFAWDAGIGTGFWFVPVDVTAEAPPVSDGWPMPTDGDGAYLVQATRDPAGTTPAQNWQTGLWGTGNSAQPPVARVGTQSNIQWTDESTPPNCGASSLATNVANGIIEGAGCENQAWTFAVPAPAPTNLATAIGFGEVLASCYANCDGSTEPNPLTIGDFVCFQSAFAAGCQ